MPLNDSINKINLWLAGSPSLNLVFLLLAVISVISSIYFFFKSKKEKIPVYLTKDFPLIQNHVATIKGLSIQFNDQKIDNLSLTRVALWNRGRETIHGTDIAHADPLRLELKGAGAILGSKISFERKTVNSIKLVEKETSVPITFDYLDHLDGAVIDVYYKGEGHIIVLGTIKGSSGLSIAKMKDGYLIDRFLDPVFNRLPKIKVKKDSIAEKLLLIIMVPILFPIFLPILIIEAVIGFLQIVPQEYNLSD